MQNGDKPLPSIILAVRGLFVKMLIKVSNGAKIRNRYNQVPHLTQDTNGKVTNSQKTTQTRAKRSALSQQVTINLELHHIYKRTLKTHHRISALFLQTLYAIEKLLGGFNVRDAVDDVTWVLTTSNIFLHS